MTVFFKSLIFKFVLLKRFVALKIAYIYIHYAYLSVLIPGFSFYYSGVTV